MYKDVLEAGVVGLAMDGAAAGHLTEGEGEGKGLVRILELMMMGCVTRRATSCDDTLLCCAALSL